MANNTIQENTYSARPIPWRKNTELHKQMGARIIAIPSLIVPAATPFTLFNGPYNEHTIDRIIGCRLNLGNTTTAGSLVVSDLNSGYKWAITTTGHFGNYLFNFETLLDSANIVLQCTFAITAAMNAYCSLHNFESPEGQIAHYS